MNKKKKIHLAYKKNLDNMKLLVSYDKFQKIIKEVRKYLKVPKSGLSSDKEIKKWYEKELYEKSDKIIGSKSFIEQEKIIREKIKLKKINRKTANKELGLILQKIPINYLHNIINFIIDKFKLPLNYYKYIREYILFDKINAPYNNFNIGPYIDVKKMSDVRYVPITIYTKLTQEEVKNLEKEIKLFNKNLPEFRPLKNIDNKLEIEDALKKENRHRVFYDGEYNINSAEIAEEYLGNMKKHKRVYEINKEIKELRKKRFE